MIILKLIMGKVRNRTRRQCEHFDIDEKFGQLCSRPFTNKSMVCTGVRCGYFKKVTKDMTFQKFIEINKLR